MAALALAGMVAADGRLPPAGVRVADVPRGGPLDRRHLAVVINADDPLSEATGRLYARERRIPAAQVLRVRLPVGEAELAPGRFRRLEAELRRRTPAHVQAYALAWREPWRVGCQSITAAVTLGLDGSGCARTCRATRLSRYHARGEVRRPWDELRLRPSMLLAASDFGQARRLIGRGLAADGTAPPGTAYLLSTSDGARNVRAAGFGVVAAAAGPGFRVRILRGDALRGARDVMAYFTGLAVVPDIASNTYRPGAVADHLTSFGGQLSGESGQMSALRWLEAGVTGSYGTVVEPCNIRAKFPDPGLVLAYYRRGDTLLEAYWRSVAMPDQGLFLGEPLARPWLAQAGLSPDAASGARARRAR
ncbi:MAG: TIGR03790 family protein [Cyanobium sp.]